MAVLEEQRKADAPGQSAAPLAGSATFSDDQQAQSASATAQRIILAILQLAPRIQTVRGESYADQQADLRGIRVGIIGPNATHCALADRLRAAFGMAITCQCGQTHELRRAREGGYDVTEDIDTLLSVADIVVAVEPGHNIADFRISAQSLNAMQPHAALITDVATVPVDQFTLAHALWFETIAGAGFIKSARESRLLPQVEKAHNVVVV